MAMEDFPPHWRPRMRNHLLDQMATTMAECDWWVERRGGGGRHIRTDLPIKAAHLLLRQEEIIVRLRLLLVEAEEALRILQPEVDIDQMPVKPQHGV